MRPWIRTHLMGRGPLSADVAAALVFTCLFTMAVWLHLDHAGIALLALAFVGFAVAPHLPVPPAIDGVAAPVLTAAGLRRSLPIAAVILVPVVWQLVATCHEEFPWSGDHYFHLFASQAFRGWWVRHALPVGVFAAVVVVKQIASASATGR